MAEGVVATVTGLSWKHLAGLLGVVVLLDMLRDSGRMNLPIIGQLPSLSSLVSRAQGAAQGA